MKHRKWQRIRYMPNTGVGENGRHITACAEHIALSRHAATEGMVLLKNDDSLLPFSAGKQIAVFGKAQADFVKGGAGSGDTIVAYTISLLDGLRQKAQEEKIALFEPLSSYYETYVSGQYANGVIAGQVKEPTLPNELLQAARKFTDTALITICRCSGEFFDRTATPFDGDFYLNHEEHEMVQSVLASFDHVAVVLNIGGVVDTMWFKDEPKVQSALIAWQGGMEGGLATAEILVGDSYPSGHLSDTFAVSYDAYPSAAGFYESDDYVEYTEDVFVGYRYFDTIAGQGEKVAYPFGFGLTYTRFELSNTNFEHVDGKIVFTASVKNVGDLPGKQVVQIYCEAPSGKIDKPLRTLCGFAKTAQLECGESENLTITIDPYYFSTYDDTGIIQKSAYVLEAGKYTLHAGFSSVEFYASHTYEIERDIVVEQLSEKCAPKQLHKRMMRSGDYRKLETDDTLPRPTARFDILPFDGEIPNDHLWTPDWCNWHPSPRPGLIDVYNGKMTLEELMDLMSVEQMINLLGGQPCRGTAVSGGVGNLEFFGIPNVMNTDGPAGLRMIPECGVKTTAFPCATLIACTWDVDVANAVSSAAALEVKENNFGIWLAPATNIHRNPLCGRNFEYYSEDPFLSGKIVSATVKGIQQHGVACSLKHFACNNKETNRRESDSRVSERALREIYLKPFEMCVKEAQPKTIMSSYNLINGVRVSANRELLTDILRGEWGFDGLVTTDWYTNAEQWEEIAAGNDIKQGKGMPEETLKALQDGKLDLDSIKLSVSRLLNVILWLD